MSQLRRGFFDASELEGLDDDGEQAAGGGGNHSPIDPGTMGDAELRREYERISAECDRLRGDGDAARRKHAADLQRVLKANEELQAQLRALHVVVGRVVASEQHRVGVGGGSARKRGVARAAVRPS